MKRKVISLFWHTSAVAALFSLTSCIKSAEPEIPKKIEKQVIEFNKKPTTFLYPSKEIVEFKENEKIRFVAFGDSVTQGFLALPFVGGPGVMDKNGDVKGISYAAVMADYIKRVQEDKIESFYNFALSGTKIFDWSYIFEPFNEEFKQYKKSVEDWIAVNSAISQNKYFNFAQPFKEYLVDGQNEKVPFSKIREKIKKANLITFSMGGNSGLLVVWTLFKRMFKEVRANPKRLLEKNVVLDYLRQLDYESSEYLKKVEDTFIKVLKNLRKMNPYASIIWVGYSFASWFLFDKIFNIVASLFFEEGRQTKKYTPLVSLFHKWRNMSKRVANKFNISYIDNYDEKTWSDWDTGYIGNVLDFHPSVFGQKRMAQNVLAKVAQNNEEIELYQQSRDYRKKLLNSTEDDFLNYDIGSFRREIYLKDEAQKTLMTMLQNEMGSRIPSDQYWDTKLSVNDLMPQEINDLFKQITFLGIGNWIKEVFEKIDWGVFATVNLQSLFKQKIKNLLENSQVKAKIKAIQDQAFEILAVVRRQEVPKHNLRVVEWAQERAKTEDGKKVIGLFFSILRDLSFIISMLQKV